MKAVEHVAGPCFALTDFPSKGFAFQLADKDPSLLAKYLSISSSFTWSLQSIMHSEIHCRVQERVHSSLLPLGQ